MACPRCQVDLERSDNADSPARRLMVRLLPSEQSRHLDGDDPWLMLGAYAEHMKIGDVEMLPGQRHQFDLPRVCRICGGVYCKPKR